MKTVPADRGGDFLGTAAWYELEAKGVEFPFPKLFGKLGDEYDKRYGLQGRAPRRISADQLRERASRTRSRRRAAGT